MSTLLRAAASLLLALATASTALAVQARTADELVQAARTEYESARRAKSKEAAVEAAQKYCDLVLELQKADPANSELPGMLPNRWMFMATVLEKSAEADKEIVELLAKDPPTPLGADARWSLAQVRMQGAMNDVTPAKLDGARKAVNAFLEKDGADKKRAAELLFYLAELYRDDAKAQLELFKQIQDKYADTQFGSAVAGRMKQLEGVGKPFALEFTDAISGKKVSMADLKGKVVVIDFWATWCGPCVQDMPHMKELYGKYKDKGVEFIGVSLDKSEDQGGLKALKDFVQKREIPWLHYYQGNGWASEFSVAWGINSIPALFVVDQNGNLYNTQGRGKLDEIFAKLLEKKSDAQ